jgi:hypothetical protein
MLTEIDATLEMKHGLIGVRLPTAPITADNKVTVPDRLHDNIQSGYALWQSWGQMTVTATQLAEYISSSKLRSAQLIVNSRERRLRNA